MTLYEDDGRASGDVKRLAQNHMDRIDGKLKELGEMRRTLSHLISECAGDQRPDCPILADLAAATSKPDNAV